MRFFKEREVADQHIAFCVKLYKLQDKAVRCYSHEHPRSATSWKLPVMQKFVKECQPFQAAADQCQFGLATSDGGESGLAKKPTEFITNAEYVKTRLHKHCTGEHAMNIF